MKKTLLYVLGGLFALGILAAMCDSEETSKDSTAVESKDAEKETANSSQKTWKITTSKDEMRGSTDTFASIESDNEVEFEFPYNGGSTLSIVVKESQKSGTNVYLSISSGQFEGHAFDGSNYVTIKFDEEPLKKYHFSNESCDESSGSMDVIFLKKEQDLIEKFKTAKKIMIEAPFFDSGSKQFTFTVDKPLEWNK